MPQTEDEIDDVKDSFYEELERVFNKFPIYHMKIMLGDFNVKVGREDNFATSKNKYKNARDLYSEINEYERGY
jgi:hypothetical protein